MTNWTEKAAEWTKDYMRSFNSVTGATYERSIDGSVIEDLSVSPITFEQTNQDPSNVDIPLGVRMSFRTIVLSADALGFDPDLGDRVTYDVNGTSVTYDVIEGPDGKPWCYFDQYRHQIQIYVDTNG